LKEKAFKSSPNPFFDKEGEQILSFFKEKLKKFPLYLKRGG
jgi:hypothetical protein